MKKLLRTGLLAFTAVAFAAGAAGAAALVQDNFNYPDGTVLSDLGTWTDHSGSSNPIATLNGKAIVNHANSSGEDIHTFLAGGARSATDVTYFCMELMVPSGGDDATSEEYYTHLMEPAGFNYHARVNTAPPNAAGDYSMSIMARGTNADATAWASDLNYDQTYQIVVKFDAAAGTATMWIDPANEGDVNVVSTNVDAVGLTSSRIALRQDSTSPGLTNIEVDNLVVATSFAEVCPAAAPSASQTGMLIMSLLLLGGGTVFMLRRRNDGTMGA